MTETPQNPPPGFYPDQNGVQRYWDGTAWTEQTQQAAATPSAPHQANGQEGERPWFKKKRFIIPGVVVALLWIGGIAGGSEDGSDDKQSASSSSTDGKATDIDTTTTTSTPDTSEADAPEVEEIPEVTEAPEPELTSGQENAIGAAEGYLDYSAFSKSGLIKQLEFEKYSKADATFAVDNIEVDWNEQAVKAAKDYLDYSSFSRGGLIEQLKFEGYTVKQAAHGATGAGL